MKPAEYKNVRFQPENFTKAEEENPDPLKPYEFF